MQGATLFIIIIIIAIVFIILLAIFGYKALYKRRANQALEGVRSTSLIDPLSFFQVIIMIVTLTLSIVALSKLEVLSSDILEQTNRINSLNNDIDFLRNNVNSLENLLNNYIESNQLVQNSRYDFGDYSNISNTVETTISFTLKEIDSSSDIYIVATNIDDATDFIKELVESETLTYTKTVSLDIDVKYQITFIIESTIHTTGGILYEIDLPRMLDNKTQFSAGVYGLNQMNYTFNFSFDTLGIDNLSIESVQLRYYKNTNMIDSTLNITSSLNFFDESGQYNLDYDSSISDMEITGFDIIVVDSWGNTWISPKIPLGPNGSE